MVLIEWCRCPLRLHPPSPQVQLIRDLLRIQESNNCRTLFHVNVCGLNRDLSRGAPANYTTEVQIRELQSQLVRFQSDNATASSSRATSEEQYDRFGFAGIREPSASIERMKQMAALAYYEQGNGLEDVHDI